MKKRNGCLATLFLFSLIIGTSIGIILKFGINYFDEEGDSLRTANAQISPTPTEIPAAKLKNLSILFIGVDRLDRENNYLVSAWLVQQENHIENNQTDIHLTLRTLYPLLPVMVPNPALKEFSQPHKPLAVNVRDFSSITSLPPLNQPNVEWDQIIIVDEYFMNSAIVYSDINRLSEPNAPSENLFKKSWDSPKEAYEMQSAILKNFCNTPDAFYLFPVATKLIELYPDHITSTFTVEELFHLWQINVNLGSDFTVTCEFFPPQ